MDRAYSSGAAGSAPSAPASPSIGYPTAGNPGVGTPPTKPGPYWYHMIMEELLGVISAAGITPAPGNLTQLLTALRSAGVFQTQATNDSSTKVATTAFANPGAQLSTSGYQKLPSGLFLQWGVAQLPAANTDYTITWPIAFPNAVFIALGSCGDAAQSVTSIRNPTTTNAIARTSSTGDKYVFYVALGR